jgi:hypothetical protein
MKASPQCPYFIDDSLQIRQFVGGDPGVLQEGLGRGPFLFGSDETA